MECKEEVISITREEHAQTHQNTRVHGTRNPEDQVTPHVTLMRHKFPPLCYDN